jgi:hypothetical protein
VRGTNPGATTEKEHTVKITKSRKMVTPATGAAAAAVTAPALLFAGAGTAQALTWVSTNTDALGVTVHVSSFGGPASSGDLQLHRRPGQRPAGRSSAVADLRSAIPIGGERDP